MDVTRYYIKFDPRYLAFDMFLDKPRVRKIRKKMTARVVTKEDIEHVLAVTKEEMLKGFAFFLGNFACNP